MSQRRRSRDVALVVVPLLAAAVTGCGGNDTAYCVDQNDNVVNEDDCDDDGNGRGGFFFWAHSPRYKKGLKPGAKLPSGGSKFAYNDAAQRSAWGLPATGRVSNGTVKSNVVGSGGDSGGGSSSKSSGG